MMPLKLEEERIWLEQTFDVGNKLHLVKNIMTRIARSMRKLSLAIMTSYRERPRQ